MNKNQDDAVPMSMMPTPKYSGETKKNRSRMSEDFQKMSMGRKLDEEEKVLEMIDESSSEWRRVARGDSVASHK